MDSHPPLFLMLPATVWEMGSQIIRLGEGKQPVSRWGRGKESTQTRAEKWTPRARQASRQVSGLLPSRGRVGVRLRPTSDRTTHLLLQKLRELTKDHRREEKQQFLPGFPLGAHYSYNPDSSGEPLGCVVLRDPPRWDWTPAARLSPARLSFHARWAAPGCLTFRLVKRKGPSMSDSPHAGAAPNFPPS